MSAFRNANKSQRRTYKERAQVCVNVYVHTIYKIYYLNKSISDRVVVENPPCSSSYKKLESTVCTFDAVNLLVGSLQNLCTQFNVWRLLDVHVLRETFVKLPNSCELTIELFLL